MSNSELNFVAAQLGREEGPMISVLKSVLILAIGIGVASCDNGAEQKGKNKKTQTADDGDSDDDDGGDADDDSDGGDEAGGDEAGDDEVSVDDAAAFQLWCDKAGETEIVKGKMKVFYNRFCEDGKPTTLFTSKLIKIAFDGSGDPETTMVEDYEHVSTGFLAGTAEATFGTCLDIPITIENHFEKVGPKQGDVESLKKLAEKQGAIIDNPDKPLTITIDEKYDNDGKYHVRGWKIHSISQKPIIIGTIKTDTLIRADQFELEKGKAYMYTQYMLDGKEGILDYDQFAAGIQLGDKTYLVTQGHVKADSKGQKDTAEEEMPKAAKILIQSNYDAAEKAK